MPVLLLDTEEKWAAAIEGRLDLTGADEIIVACGDAEMRMQALASRGVSEERLSWMGDGKLRDFRWSGHRWADDLPPTPEHKYLQCGIDGLGRRVRWRSYELGLVAGPHSSGKSLFVQVLAQDFVNRNDQLASLTCWEDQEDEIRDGFALYRDSTAVPDDKKDGFLRRFRLTLVERDDERDISKHFERIKYEAKRFGIKFFVLDPWNEFDHVKHKNQTEADYVIRVLTEAAKLCRSLDIIILLTTHVSSEYISLGDDFKPFRINNAFGTSQFGNKVHRGFCITRTRKWDAASHMIVRHDKAKLENKVGPGFDGKPTLLKERMGYPDTMVFTVNHKFNTIHHDELLSKEAREKWK